MKHCIVLGAMAALFLTTPVPPAQDRDLRYPPLELSLGDARSPLPGVRVVTATWFHDTPREHVDSLTSHLGNWKRRSEWTHLAEWEERNPDE